MPNISHATLLGQFLQPRAQGDISLSWFEVGVAATLLLINAIISLQLGLGIAKRIATSSVRMTIQLAILGLVLKQIFELAQPTPVLGLAAVMTVIAGVSAVKRIDHRYPTIYRNSIFAVWTSAWVVTSITVLLIVRPQPWYSPQVVIPLLGMVLGNSLTGISLGLDRFLSELKNRRGEVETMLALGATRWESCRGVFIEATRTAMIPILNTMSVAGIVSIPGMMTGQLLAGAEPIDAVKYQIMIMFVIAAAIAIGVVLSLSLSYRNVTNSQHQIEWQRIQRP
ncbi:MAG: iron export ABC transporter permease subunit FetB [Planctomycetaceae bacterium]|nr:iron export ABC transporter permease subunit FetB [Planctomycetaceae bacterium]